MSRVADILIAQGRAAADARRYSGALWGRAVESISQIPGQIYEGRRAEERQRMEDARADRAEQRAQAEELNTRRLRDLQFEELQDKRQATNRAIAQDEAAKLRAAGYPTADTMDWIQSGTSRGLWTADEGARLLGLAKARGARSAVDLIAPLQEPERPMEHDPTKALVTPSGKELIAAQPPADKATTYGEFREALVDGRRTMIRTGSDGKTYDSNGKVITGKISYERASDNQGGAEDQTYTQDYREYQAYRDDWNKQQEATAAAARARGVLTSDIPAYQAPADFATWRLTTKGRGERPTIRPGSPTRPSQPMQANGINTGPATIIEPPAAPAAPTPASKYQVGQVVTMKDGKRVKITAISPDGTSFQGTPVK